MWDARSQMEVLWSNTFKRASCYQNIMQKEHYEISNDWLAACVLCAWALSLIYNHARFCVHIRASCIRPFLLYQFHTRRQKKTYVAPIDTSGVWTQQVILCRMTSCVHTWAHFDTEHQVKRAFWGKSKQTPYQGFLMRYKSKEDCSNLFMLVV